MLVIAIAFLAAVALIIWFILRSGKETKKDEPTEPSSKDR